MCLPMLFLILLIFVKRSYDEGVKLGVKLPGGALLKPGDSFIPEPQHTYQPMTFTDTVTALQAKKMCKWVVDENGDDSHFEITGIFDRSKNWQIPYVRCNSQLCTEHGQDATDFCEYTLFVVAGSNYEGSLRAQKFSNWVYQRYPGLNTNNNTRIVHYMEYEEDSIDATAYPTEFGKGIDQYVTSREYGTTLRKISMAIVFNGSDPNSYIYAIRQNSTNFNVVEDQDSIKPATKTTPKSKYLYKVNAASDLESCSTLTASSGINAGDLGFLGTSCTGQYMYNGVLAAQRLVHDYILYDTGSAEAGYNVAEAGVQFVQFPQGEYDPSGFFIGNCKYRWCISLFHLLCFSHQSFMLVVHFLTAIPPVLLALGLLYTVAAMISYLVQEKELRQKELMKMMSVTEFDIELSWFLTFMSMNVVTAFLCTIVSSYLFKSSAPAFLFLFWLLTFLTLTLYSTGLSACSSKAVRGILIGLLFYFSGLFLALIFPSKYISDSLFVIINLHPVALFSNAITLLGGLEDLHLGFESESIHYWFYDTETKFRQILMCQLYCSLFWFLVTWYLNRSVTPEYGQATEVWYFPFTSSYWKSFVQRRTYAAIKEKESNSDEVVNDEAPVVEPVSEILKKQSLNGESIEIVNLRKSFGDKAAVNGLNMSMYNGQITALLGHNGT